MNRFITFARPPLLCLGPGKDGARDQKKVVESLGGAAVTVPENLEPAALNRLADFSGVLWWGDEDAARAYALALAELDGPLIPLVTGLPDKAHVLHERHLCVDTTAAGSNTSLLAGQ